MQLLKSSVQNHQIAETRAGSAPALRKSSPLAKLCAVFFGTAGEKRRLRYALLEKAANRLCGCWIPEDLKLWLEDQEFLASYRRLEPHHLRMAERTFAVRELVASLDHVPGDTVEVGAYRGKTSYFICQARGRGTHHVFDSFEGLSNPQMEDTPDNKTAFHWRRGDLTAQEEVIRTNLAEFTNVEYYRGWVPDRFPEVADRQFAFVHIDVDLYQPTLDSLKFFYPRLESCGIIICDDYGFTSCPGAYRAMHEYMQDKPEKIIHLPTGQGMIIKQ